MRQGALVLAAAPLCAGHGAMNKPPTWLDRDAKFVYAAGQNGAGCTGKAAPGEIESAQGCVAEWYTNNTFIPGKATIPVGSPLITYGTACKPGHIGSSAACCAAPCTDTPMPAACAGCDYTATHPWRAPGTAAVSSPCGIDGGNLNGCPEGNPNGDGCAGGGYGHGPDGRSLEGNSKPEEWTAGGEAEVSWGITANHGGGYQYRLCKKPASYADLTEDCFQQTPLRFVGDTQWLQVMDNVTGRVAIAAKRTDSGTHPAGSQWTMNPVPACGGFGGGAPAAGGMCIGTQFPEPAPGVHGFLGLPWNIIDKVQVPQIAPGDYVVSFRYDCEQTSQVWNQCGDVRIVA